VHESNTKKGVDDQLIRGEFSEYRGEKRRTERIKIGELTRWITVRAYTSRTSRRFGITT